MSGDFESYVADFASGNSIVVKDIMSCVGIDNLEVLLHSLLEAGWLIDTFISSIYVGDFYHDNVYMRTSGTCYDDDDTESLFVARWEPSEELTPIGNIYSHNYEYELVAVEVTDV